MKVQIVNPTDTAVSIKLHGEVYSVEANSVSEPLEDSLAEEWRKIHGFLSVKAAPEVVDGETGTVDVPNVSPEPTTTATTGEIVVENGEVKPKKRGRPKKNG